jgi:predicted AAA+ superfamily ATPase
MIRQVLPDVPYLSFDDPDEESAFRRDPRALLSRFPDKIILDEVQRVPDLFRYLKIAIDADPGRKGRFVLTGSNQFSFHKGISESLAGRVGLLRLLPFETREIPQESRADQLLLGSYPALVTSGYEGAREWYSSYFGSYLEKDVRLVFDIGKLTDFQLVVRLLAARTGQEQNSASISREIGVSAKTVESWISVLEAGYIVFRLEPFHGNIGKRLIKRPKLYFWDTGLVCHLTGLRDREALEGGPLAGPVLETLMVAELKKRSFHQGSDRDFWFYRDNAGREIDLIVHDRYEKAVSCIEIKSGKTPKAEWAYQAEAIVDRISPSFVGADFRTIIAYRGETKRNWPKAGVDYINWQEMLGDSPDRQSPAKRADLEDRIRDA